MIRCWILASSTFRAYSVLHGAVIATVMMATAGMIWLRRHCARRGRSQDVDRALGLAALAVWAAYKVYAFLPGIWSIETSLPLQLCDITGLLVPLALLTNYRPYRGLVYFWGIGLTTQAFIGPDLQHGPDTVKFWLFWLTHAAIVGTAVYEVAARGFWPRWRDYLLSLACLAVYLMVVLPIDLWFGLNYGYVGRPRPREPAIVTALGAWPGRVVVISVLIILALGLLFLPWELARRGKSQEQFVHA